MGWSCGYRVDPLRGGAGRLRRGLVALLCVASAGCAAAGGNGGEPAEDDRAQTQSREGSAGAVRRPPLDGAWVIFGTDTVVAEVARTADERAQGLMNRDEVPDGTGMLFVFEDSAVRSFWMANTYVALDVAYMDATFRIVDIVSMEPLVTDPYSSSAPAMFALEVRQGWFAEHGIEVGSVAQIVFGVQTGG